MHRKEQPGHLLLLFAAEDRRYVAPLLCSLQKGGAPLVALELDEETPGVVAQTPIGLVVLLMSIHLLCPLVSPGQRTNACIDYCAIWRQRMRCWLSHCEPVAGVKRLGAS